MPGAMPEMDASGSKASTSNSPSLREQIALAMEPWQDTNAKPPFSIEELVLMALVSTDGLTTRADISKWITESAGFYSELAAKALFALQDYDWMYRDRVPQWQKDVGVVRSDISDALYRSSTVSTFRRVRADPTGQDTWSATGDEAFSFLTSSLAPLFPEIYLQSDASRPFPFFQLPAEIRAIIYDMVYFPSPGGVRVECGSSESYTSWHDHGDLHIMISAQNPVFEFDSWTHDGPHHKDICFSKVSKALESLIVCKQYYQEATPSFFTKNIFYCSCVDALQSFLTTLMPSRMAPLANLAVVYRVDNNDIQAAPKTFALLTEIPRLRSLALHIDEQAWSDRKNGNGDRTYPDLARLPGFPALKKVSASGNVTFHKTNAAAAEVMKTAMSQPQGDVATESSARAKGKKHAKGSVAKSVAKSE